MHHSLKKLGLFSSVLFSTVVSSTAYSATLNIVTKYGDSGGNAGNLNSQGDQVNGNDICPADNTYANATPGCDMSADVGYSDGGTGDPSDDSYSGDLIVRTNDLFNVAVGYSWLGNAGGAEEEVTLTGTLPAGKGFVFEGIPGSCDQAASTLSPDRKTINCVRKDFDTNNTGSFAEDMAFPVRVEGDAANGSIPGDITFTINDPTDSGPVSDGVEDGNSANLLKITSAPRWNIDKHGGAGYYTTTYGAVDDQGNRGWILWYQFSIEVDEVTGTTDTASGKLGNEALQGGTNATVSFVDDLTNVSPNAKLVTWDSNSQFSPGTNPCDMDFGSNADEPYTYLHADAAYADRSIKTPKGTMTVSCTPSGADPKKIDVTVTGIDGTLTNAPIKNVNGGLLPVNRAIAAIGVMRVFVPVSDVVAAGGQLTTRNCLSDFNPVGISGGSNFGSASESTVDNCRDITLYSTAGSFDKNYRKGWSDQGVEISKWGGGRWSLPPTDASLVAAGDGTVTPGGVYGSYVVYRNTGGTDIDNPVVCDVIDTETYEMTIIDPVLDNPGTFLDDTKHAVDLNYSTTETVPGIKVQYATGYVGSWPPNPDETPATGTDEVVAECSIPENQWFDTIQEAEAAGGGAPVSKARMTAPTLPAGKSMVMRIKHTARATFLTSGQPIPNDTLLINHATYKSALTSNNFRAGSYIPHDVNNPPENRAGDRLTMVRAKARILKAMEPAAVSPGSDVTVTLTPSFTTDGPLQEVENVTITDLLPRGLTYTNGTTVGTYGDTAIPYGEPQIISPVTDADCVTHVQDLMDNGQSCGTFGGDDNNTDGGQSLLVWNLGSQTTGTVYEDIVFHSIVDIDAPTGVLANYVLIDSPADSSQPSQRIANANTNDTVPSSLLPVKSVLTPLREVNSGSVLNWMQFKLGLRNGSSSTLDNLDVIDILPFIGDGVEGSFTYTPQAGTTVPRKREPATSYDGTFEFDDVTFDNNPVAGVDQCTGTPTYWFTNVDTTTTALDISPLHASNAIPNGSTNWCGGDATVADSLATCGFAKSDVTAVRVRDASMNPSAICFINITYATNENLDGDVYSNTFSAKADGVTNGVLSNTVSAKVFASSLGDKVWFDTNADGIQDDDEDGIAGIVVKLLDSNGDAVKDPANPANDYQVTTDANGNYKFDNLVAGDYVVEFVTGAATLTSKTSGNDTELDSDANADGKTDTITLAENEDRIDIDAGINKLGSIGNYVWNDINNDGVQEAGESGVDGVTVTLLDGSGNPILDDSDNPITTTTANGGAYKFDNLLPGDYSVGFSNLPAGFGFTTANQGDDAKDSDANAGTGKTASITLGLGEDNTTLDAGLFKPASLGNYVWNDVNHDGKQDDSEAGVDGVTVTLLDGSGNPVLDSQNNPITTTTANGGAYNFTNLIPGSYSVGFSNLPTGFELTTSNQGDDAKDSDADAVTGKTASVTLAAGDNNTTLDAGLFKPASLGNYVWDDANNDGIQNGSEAGVDGVTVTLLDGSGNPVLDGSGNAITTTTANGGAYSFDNLAPGTYSVGFSNLPAGFGFTTPNQGDDAKDSDADATTGKTASVTLAAGDSNTTLDAGLFKPASLGNYVWNDANQDGKQDDSEAGIDGVTVSLLDGSGNPVLDSQNNPITTTTANGGAYSFDNLAAGTYSVGFSNLPTDFEFTKSNEGDDAKDSDADATTGKTASVTLAAGDNNTTLDAGLFKPASLGNYVWNDKDNDGIQDDDEAGIDGVVVTLYDANGDVVKTITTANGGAYSFDDLEPGTYSVGFVAPEGFEITKKNIGDAAKDSDIDANGKTATITLGAGEDNATIDAGFFVPASIGDTIWHDKNNDGVVDEGEALAGVKVTLTLPDGSTQELITDENGKYLFTDLPEGEFTVTVDESTLPEALQGKNTQDPDGGNDSTSTVTLDGTGGNLDQDFAYVALGSIGDTVLKDTDNDGTGDEALAGLTVTLTPPANVDLGNGVGQPITTTTDGDGKYLFSDLPAGDYSVEVETPAGLANTVDPDGGFDSKSALTLAEGEDNLDQDFVYAEVGHISGKVERDSDDDGVGDAPIAGVVLKLLDGNGEPVLDGNGDPITTVTAVDGSYTFRNLPLGDYQVAQVQPAGYASVSDTGNDDPENMITAISVTGGETAVANDFVEKANAAAPPPNTQPIPTLSEWALIMLMMMLGLVAIRQAKGRGGVRF